MAAARRLTSDGRPLAPAPGPGPVPVTRPRGLVAFLLPLPVAAAAGLGAGLVAAHRPGRGGRGASRRWCWSFRLEWAALAVIGIAVFEDYLDLVSPWATEWLAVVLVVAWLVRRAQGPLHGHRLRPAAVPAVVFAAAVVVAAAVHPHGSAGLAVCATYAGLVVVMLVLADCLSGPLAPRRAARLYVAVLRARLAAAGSSPLSSPSRHRVAGPVAERRHLAFFLVAAVPLVGTVRTRASQPVWWVWACFARSMVAGVGTQSRPAFVALVAMVLVAVADRPARAALRRRAARPWSRPGSRCVLAVLPLPDRAGAHRPAALRRHQHRPAQRRSGWRRSEMTRASPVVGLGPGGVPAVPPGLPRRRTRPGRPRPRHRPTAPSWRPRPSSGVLGLARAVRRLAGPRRRRPPALAARPVAADRGHAAGPARAARRPRCSRPQQYVLPLWFLAAMALALGRPGRPRMPVFGADRTTGRLDRWCPDGEFRVC